MNDLELLARNAHEWPECYDSADVEIIHDVSVVSFRFGPAGKYSRFDWLAERARLQNKPSWSDAPEWVNWIAQWSDGQWLGYDVEPEKGNVDDPSDCYVHPSSEPKLHRFKYGEVLGDWRDTLEKRPEPFRLTGSESIPKHINCRCVMTEVKQEWDGEGFPPVGTVCEVRETITEFSEFAKWSECKVLAVNIGQQKDKQFIIRDNNGDAAILYEVDGIEFRSLLTDEQKAISEIETMINEWLKKEGGAEHIAKSIYDYCIKNQDAAE